MGGQQRHQLAPFFIGQIMTIQAIIHSNDLHQPGPKIYASRPRWHAPASPIRRAR